MATRKTTKATSTVRLEQNFKVESITVDKALQPRVNLNSDAIADYKDVIFEGGELPPLDLVQDGETYYLVDGFHRLSAYKKLGILEVPANIRAGSREDAILFAIGANRTHGLRRSNPDKRRAVEMALGLMTTKGVNWTDTHIAELAGVSSMFVGNVRKELIPETKTAERTTPDGKTITPVGRGRKASTIELKDEDSEDSEPAEPKAKGFKAINPEKGSKSGPLGVQVDRIINRVGALELAITELMGIFPNAYNLGEAIAQAPALAVTFGKIRKRVEAAGLELNSVPLPYEVTEDAKNVATPEPEAPKSKDEAKAAVAEKRRSRKAKAEETLTAAIESVKSESPAA